ncbi:hypothetical protein D3C80_1946620 [compost metagenome]
MLHVGHRLDQSGAGSISLYTIAQYIDLAPAQCITGRLAVRKAQDLDLDAK